MSAVADALDLIDAVVYADLFDCAVTQDEVWRFSRVRISREQLADDLDRPEWSGALYERQGYYCLRGREELVDSRPVRRERALRLQKRARRVARWLQHVPFIRGALLTGSVAADDATPDADVDLLVMVAPERLALVFAVLAPLSRLLSRKLFCPNYYLSTDHVTLGRRSHYIARELVQARPLVGGAAAVLEANDWVEAFLPNAAPTGEPGPPLPGGRILQRLLEAPVRGALGDRLEGWAQKLALSRLQHHHGEAGQAVPAEVVRQLRSEVELRFHESDEINRLGERYEARRAEVGRMLQDAGFVGDRV